MDRIKPIRHGEAIRWLLILISALVFPPALCSQTYLDSTAAIDERVEELLSRMTLEEKIGQMTQADRQYLQSEEDIKTYGLGSILSGGGSSPPVNAPDSWADMYDRYQSYALQTRLKIPLIYGIDAVHGHNNVKGAVIFPHNIGMGCTRNDSLVEVAARITAKEVAGTGIDWTFGPCIAVPRDERWGRTYEGFGETPELAEHMAGASVRGFQGQSLAHGSTILACAKHYVGDGGTTNGIDQGDTRVDESTLRAIHLPGYISAIEAGVGSIMASFSSWNGQKLHSHHYLLTTVLKEELGFEGFVVSDWAGIDQLPGPYSIDVENSINAGIDMVMVPNRYPEFIHTLRSLVEEGKISVSRIDDAVRRILRMKFKLGLFEHPFADRSLISQIGSTEHREVARACVRESLVLLKKKDGVLPISKNLTRIHVAGKHADNLGFQCGGWTITWQGGSGDITTGTTILEAIRQAAPAANVTFTEDGTQADGADIGIAIIGETPYAEGRGDRSNLAIAEQDIRTVRNLKNAGLKVVVILISGRPLILTPILHYCDAIFAVWLPGSEGLGVTDVLFGDYPPKGKLSHSWPRNMEQIPINYGDANYDPLFPYDHGMTSFANSAPGASPEFYSAATTSDGRAVEVAFNKNMAEPSPSADGFIVNVSGLQNSVVDVQLKPQDESTLILTLAAPVLAHDAVTVAYIEGSIHAEDGGKLASFEPQFVYNDVVTSSAFQSVPGRIEAEDFATMSGVQTEITADIGGGLNVGWIDAGDWMSYNLNVQSSGAYSVSFRVASASHAGQIQLQRNGSTLASINLPVTGGWQVWQTVSTFVYLPRGPQTLTVLASAGGFNLNWLEFSFVTEVAEDERIPNDLELSQNYPNPFNASTRIHYFLPRASHVTLKVFDLLGEEIATLVDQARPGGSHVVSFDAGELPSGLYFYRLESGPFTAVRKALLMR